MCVCVCVYVCVCVRVGPHTSVYHGDVMLSYDHLERFLEINEVVHGLARTRLWHTHTHTHTHHTRTHPIYTQTRIRVDPACTDAFTAGGGGRAAFLPQSLTAPPFHDTLRP
jgi:hypothetical protein